MWLFYRSLSTLQSRSGSFFLILDTESWDTEVAWSQARSVGTGWPKNSREKRLVSVGRNKMVKRKGWERIKQNNDPPVFLWITQIVSFCFTIITTWNYGNMLFFFQRKQYWFLKVNLIFKWGKKVTLLVSSKGLNIFKCSFYFPQSKLDRINSNPWAELPSFPEMPHLAQITCWFNAPPPSQL